jgi:hypothetical protein
MIKFYKRKEKLIKKKLLIHEKQLKKLTRKLIMYTMLKKLVILLKLKEKLEVMLLKKECLILMLLFN